MIAEYIEATNIELLWTLCDAWAEWFRVKWDLAGIALYGTVVHPAPELEQ